MISSPSGRCCSLSWSMASGGNRGSLPSKFISSSPPSMCQDWNTSASSVWVGSPDTTDAPVPGCCCGVDVPRYGRRSLSEFPRMNIDLSGRAAVITGGSKGVGLGVATQFAASGADVAIVARGRAALDQAAAGIGRAGRGRVIALQGDVALAADIRRVYDEAMAAFGKIDIAVNNAGESRTGAFEEITEEIWREDFDQKLFAAIRLTRLVWPQMKERRWGRIINVLNIGAKAPRPGSAPTSITRAAGMALTKVLAGEGAPHNVLVNALLIGL